MQAWLSFLSSRFLNWFALYSQIDMVFIGLRMLVYGTGFGNRRTLSFGGQCPSIDGYAYSMSLARWKWEHVNPLRLF